MIKAMQKIVSLETLWYFILNSYQVLFYNSYQVEVANNFKPDNSMTCVRDNSIYHIYSFTFAMKPRGNYKVELQTWDNRHWYFISPSSRKVIRCPCVCTCTCKCSINRIQLTILQWYRTWSCTICAMLIVYSKEIKREKHKQDFVNIRVPHCKTDKIPSTDPCLWPCNHFEPVSGTQS